MTRLNLTNQDYDPFSDGSSVELALAKIDKNYHLFKRVTEARDDLLAARERRRQAKDAYRDACKRASISDGDFEWYPKFELEDGYDDSYVFTKRCQKAYPDLIQGESCHWHHDFIAWYAAGKEKYEANKAHGIALRRLLQIGVNK